MKLVAAADIYDGRLTQMKEVYGSGMFTTRDYREMLARNDVDAVIIATPDHWHATITKDALQPAKMSTARSRWCRRSPEGHEVIEAHKKTDRILQVGSQYASSIVLREGRASCEVRRDRRTQHGRSVARSQHGRSARGSTRFRRTLRRRTSIGIAFSATRRSGRSSRSACSAGATTATTAPESAGDLFVHLLTGLHVVTGSLGPTRIYSCGGTALLEGRARCSGRDAGCTGLSEDGGHPEFTFSLRVNLACGNVTEVFRLPVRRQRRPDDGRLEWSDAIEDPS